MINGLAGAPKSLLSVAKEKSPADVYLLVAKEGLYLHRRGEPVGGSGPGGAPSPQYFGPYEIGSTPSPKLDRALRFVAQGINLCRLSSDDELEADDERSVNLEAKFSLAKNKDGPYADVADLAKASFTDGDHLRITLTNRGDAPVDVTVLYLDAAFQIQSHYPTMKQALSGLSNTLHPGQSHNVTIRLNDSTIGLENILVLGVARDPVDPPVNFAFLAQAGLTQAGFDRTRGNSRSPLDDLLTAGLFEGSRGSATADDARSFSIQRHSVTIVKKP
jgi:hypothetical protein